MICHKIAVLSIVLHVYFAYAYTIDPCASIRCGNNEQACLEIIPRSSPEKGINLNLALNVFINDPFDLTNRNCCLILKKLS